MIQIFEYQNSSIQFEVIDGQVMANATLMGKAFGKKPDDVFKTKTWIDFENAVIDETDLRFEDIRTVKNGDAGGSWIHQELVIEFARRLNPKFALWCNRKVAELLATGKTQLEKPKTPAELLLEQAQMLVDHERKLSVIEEKVNYLIEERESARQELSALPLSEESVPEETVRAKIVKLVNVYARYTSLTQQEVWNKLYERMLYLYHINLKAYKKQGKEKTNLDVAERIGCLDKLHALISEFARKVNVSVDYHY